jgi:hypothetical protein
MVFWLIATALLNSWLKSKLIARWRRWESHAGSGGAGVDSMVTINQYTGIFMDFAGKRMRVKYISGSPGVLVHNSDNHFIREKVGWEPKLSRTRDRQQPIRGSRSK